MLNQLETVTVTAFLTALVELDSSLPQQLQLEINKVGELWKNKQPDAINQLLELAKDDSISQLYLQARIRIQKKCEIQERNKFDKPSQQNQTTTAPVERLENIALSILEAVDSKVEAQKNKSEIIPIAKNP